MSEKLVPYGLMALVVISPLPFGGNLPWAWAVYAIIAALLVIAYSIETARTRTAFPVPLSRIAVPAILVLGVAVWIILQAFPVLPATWANPLWAIVPEALEVPGRGTVSINPDETMEGLMRLLTYSGVFWLSLQLSRDRSTGERFVKVIGWAIAAYAAYGLLLWAFNSETILWYEKEAYQGDLTSTFVNRNSFATYVGMGCVILLILLMRWLTIEFADRQNMPWSKRFVHIVGSSRELVLYALPLLMVFCALLLTHSRAGFGATLVAMLLAFALWQSRQHRGFIAGMIGLAVLMVVIGYWIVVGGDALLARFADVNSSTETRMNVYIATMRAIGDYVWTGSGYGTFNDIFPMYRDESISVTGVWDKAHNTYLELLLGLGIPGAIALIAAVLWLVVLCAVGAFNRRRGRHMPLIAFAVSVLVGLHALVDFSLQMAGVAITYSALLGIGVAQSWSTREKHP
ncbi:O-antigen ligase family protein [Rhodoligotrophos ferricapiens]|uniref:O-antigen ligase family protein n=1 Tax=Rhodoligotrophos ferricapiens TaxID=3069264 RepID=UPI003D819206